MAVAAEYGVRMRWFVGVAVVVTGAAVIEVRLGIDTGVTAGGQCRVTFAFALTERAQFVAVFAIRAVNAAAGVGVGNTDAFFGVHIFDAGLRLTGAVLANTGFPTGLGDGAVVVMTSASADFVMFAGVLIRMITVLAFCGDAGACCTSSRFPAIHGGAAGVVV